MELFRKYIEIAEHIAALITGSATDADVRKLEQWKQDHPHHGKQLEQLLKNETYAENETRLGKFPSNEGWNNIKKQLVKNTPYHRKWTVWVKYAALIVLSIGSCWLYTQLINRDEKIEITIHSTPIPAGKQGARLTLDNGNTIILQPDKTLTISETDGTQIKKDAAGINYTAVSHPQNTTLYNEIETLTGMEYKLTLSDGSQIYLNAESRLKYPVTFGGPTREVELHGEAFFKIAPNAAHPFIVKMHGVNVKVLGTSFNARAYSNEPEIITTLVEGHIELNGQPMVPGDQARYAPHTGNLTINPVETDQYTAWQSGRFIFRNERLENIMKTLSRWYGIKYDFIDNASKEILIGASFARYEDMSPIIEMLRRTELVEVVQSNRGIYLSVKK